MCQKAVLMAEMADEEVISSYAATATYGPYFT
jgi:hypothetical protein